MARQRRETVPQDTRVGLLVDYASLKPHLAEAEVRGRAWIFERAAAAKLPYETPSDADVLELHRVMFAPIYEWAGKPRHEDRGPGGHVPVASRDVRIELAKLAGDLQTWVSEAAWTGGTIAMRAAVLADAHHRFQWIHPFPDTNGRTGRALDHFLLWVTFGAFGPDVQASLTLTHFPDTAAEDDYFDGLAEADNGRPMRLRAYYERRILAALDSLRGLSRGL
jgi:fido (protein-threonine AMPylation protein)